MHEVFGLAVVNLQGDYNRPPLRQLPLPLEISETQPEMWLQRVCGIIAGGFLRGILCTPSLLQDPPGNFGYFLTSWPVDSGDEWPQVRDRVNRVTSKIDYTPSRTLD
jgi:hypothetical protein